MAKIDVGLPHDAGGRLMLGLASVLFAPLCAAGFWGMLTSVPAPPDLVGRIGCVLVEELLFTATLFFGSGLIWCIFKPAWLEASLNAITVKLAWLLIPISVPVIGAVLWVLTFG
jgi:hypothetical protein